MWLAWAVAQILGPGVPIALLAILLEELLSSTHKFYAKLADCKRLAERILRSWKRWRPTSYLACWLTVVGPVLVSV